ASTVTVAGAGAVAHGSIQTPAPSSGARRRGHRSTMPPVGVAGLAPATMAAGGRGPPAGEGGRTGGGTRGLAGQANWGGSAYGGSGGGAGTTPSDPLAGGQGRASSIFGGTYCKGGPNHATYG